MSKKAQSMPNAKAASKQLQPLAVDTTAKKSAAPIPQAPPPPQQQQPQPQLKMETKNIAPISKAPQGPPPPPPLPQQQQQQQPTQQPIQQQQQLMMERKTITSISQPPPGRPPAAEKVERTAAPQAPSLAPLSLKKAAAPLNMQKESPFQKDSLFQAQKNLQKQIEVTAKAEAFSPEPTVEILTSNVGEQSLFEDAVEDDDMANGQKVSKRAEKAPQIAQKGKAMSKKSSSKISKKLILDQNEAENEEQEQAAERQAMTPSTKGKQQRISKTLDPAVLQQFYQTLSKQSEVDSVEQSNRPRSSHAVLPPVRLGMNRTAVVGEAYTKVQTKIELEYNNEKK